MPQEILKFDHNTTGPMLVNVGLLGKFEVKRFWDDLEMIVAKIWGSWGKMHAARHTRQWDIEEMRAALAGHLWSLWQESAGFPDDPVIKKWFRGFVIYRYKNTRRARGRQRSTSPKPLKPRVRNTKVRVPPTFPRFHVPYLRAPLPFGPPNAPAASQLQYPYTGRPPNALTSLQRQVSWSSGSTRAPAPTHIHLPQAPGTDRPAASLDDTTSPAYGPHPPQLQSSVIFDELIVQIKKQRPLKVIMFECLEDNWKDTEVLGEHVRIAHKATEPFYLINVIIELEEYADRVRAESSKYRPENAFKLRDSARNYQHADFGNLSRESRDGVEIDSITLDITGLRLMEALSKEN